jgi:hypothetical protein
MNKKIHTWILFLALLGIFSCNTKTEPDRFNNFEEVRALPFEDTLQHANVISLEEEIELFNPLRIQNVNDQYLIISLYSDNNFINVFRLPEMDFLYSWGRQGRGADEFMHPPVYLQNRSNELIMYDAVLQNLRFYAVSDTELVKTQRTLPLLYDGQRDPLNRISRINDSLYFADYGSSTENTNSEYVALRPDSEEPLFTFGKYPETELGAFQRYAEYAKTNVSKPDGSRFAAFYINYNKFKIFNTKGQEVTAVQVEDPFLPENTQGEDDFDYRYAACATNNYIYLLGFNGSREKLINNNSSSFKTSSEIWNWEGEPVHRSMFDRPIHMFTVSEKYRKLYGYLGIEDILIYEYDLPDIDL